MPFSRPVFRPSLESHTRSQAGPWFSFVHLAPVVQKVDSAIHWTNLYPVDTLFIQWIALSTFWTTGAWRGKLCIIMSKYILGYFSFSLLCWRWVDINTYALKCLLFILPREYNKKTWIIHWKPHPLLHQRAKPSPQQTPSIWVIMVI